MAPKIIYQQPQQDSGGIYNRETVFKLENYGLIKMIFLIFEVRPNAVSAYATPSSPYLIQDVSLESFGNPIAHNTTSYILGRMDELDTDLYNQVVDGCNYSEPFDQQRLNVVSLPLFFWCIDNQLLDPFNYPSLTIRCRTKASFDDMGFSIPLRDMNVKMKVFYDQSSSNLYKIPKQLKSSYNVFRTITSGLVGDVAGATYTHISKLNVPFEVCNVYMMLRLSENARTKGVITSVKLGTPTHEIGTFDNITNYFLGEKNSANSGNTFAIQLANRYAKRNDYMNFNGQQNPTIAEITYKVDLVGTYNLYIAFEYYSNIVESDGMLFEDNTRSFVRG